MATYCKGSTLNNGFQEMAPPSRAVPHPFVLYDVTEEDWKWFLYTVKISASLSPLNRIAAGAVPLVLGLGILGLCYASARVAVTDMLLLSCRGHCCPRDRAHDQKAQE